MKDANRNQAYVRSISRLSWVCFALMVFCLSPGSYAGTPEYKSEYRYGIVDGQGKEILAPLYEYVDHFDEKSGLALVRINRGKYGFVDPSGKFVIEPRYEIAGAFNKELGLAPVKLNGKWGFVDRAGKVAIEPRYEQVYPFGKLLGLIPVKLNGKWGLVDVAGAMVVEPKFDSAPYVQEDFGYFVIRLNGKSGFVDRTGKVVVEPKYEFAPPYKMSLGLFAVKVDGKFGYIDRTGKIVIEPQFDEVGHFSETFGLAKARQNRKWGFIDRAGKFVIEPTYDYAWNFYDSSNLIPVGLNGQHGLIDRTGKFVVEPRSTRGPLSPNTLNEPSRADRDGKMGLVDPTGKFIFEPLYEDIEFLDESGLARAKINGKWGLIDRTGKFVIEPIFESLSGRFDKVSDLAIAKINGKYGYIDRTGKFVIEPIFESLSGRFDEMSGLAIAKINGKYGYIDRTGKFVVEPKFEKFLPIGKSNFILAQIKDKWGLIERPTGKVVIEPIYEKVERLERHPELALVKLNGKWGVLDRNGKYVVNPQYEDITPFDKEAGVAFVMLDGKWGVIDSAGRTVVKPKYEYIGRLTDGYFRVGLADLIEPTKVLSGNRSRFYVGVEGKFRDSHPQLPSCGFPELNFPVDFSVFAAGAYSGRKISFQIDQSGNAGTQIDVAVNSPDKPVALILGAYEPTIWNIAWSKGSKILAVLVGGHHRQAVAGLPKDIPLQVSSRDNQGPCGTLYVDLNNLRPLNPLSRRVFGRPVDMVFPAVNGQVVVGRPMGSGDKLVRSGDITPESFYDKNAPLAGPEGLVDAVRRGLLRKATEADAESWLNAVRQSSPPRDLPPVAGDALPKRRKLSFHDGYVVLKPFVFPVGLYGAHSASFFVLKGIPFPTGNPGHSTVYDFNTLKCHGVGCGSLSTTSLSD